MSEVKTVLAAPCRVKIIKSANTYSWYHNLIDEEFDVDNAGGVYDYVLWEDYIHKSGIWRHIKKEDCERVPLIQN